MKTKKDKKRDNSSSNSSDSSSDSSHSSGSPSPKKSHKSKRTHSKKQSKSTSADRDKGSNKQLHTEQEDDKAKRKEIEHSKWDSPVERGDKKRKAESKEATNRDSREGRRDDDRRENDRRDNDRRDDDRRNNDRRDDDRRDKNRRRNDDHAHRHYNERDRSRENRQDRAQDDRRGGDRNRNNDNERHHRSPARTHNDRDRHRNNNNRRRRSRSGSFDHSKATWGRSDQQGDKRDKGGPNAQKEKEKPNFGLSGKLTEETNTYKGVVIKYSEPPEARKPKRRWRLYPFKGEKAMQTLFIHRESAFLVGRDRKVVDLPVDHPSCSKQHAAIQYRLVPFTRDDGSTGKRVRPYLIDLESANGTFINNKKIDSRKYVELLEKDVIKFGFSSREYVLLHENSKDDAMDDDVKLEEEVAVKNEPED